MRLFEFFEAVYFQLLQLYEWSNTIHPFEDFPTVSLWSLFMGSTLVMLIMRFVPGLNREDVENDDDF